MNLERKDTMSETQIKLLIANFICGENTYINFKKIRVWNNKRRFNESKNVIKVTYILKYYDRNDFKKVGDFYVNIKELKLKIIDVNDNLEEKELKLDYA